MSTTTSTIPVGVWALDPVHSTVGFEIDYMGGTFKGEFRQAEATLSVGEDYASIEGAAKVASIDVKDENLSAHLQSPDFFDAERHPELRFAAGEIDIDGETVTVPGEITIKGVTKPVEVTGTVVPALTDAYGRDRVGLKLHAAVDRDEFGVSWNVPLPSGEPALSNQVAILADLFLVKAA